MGAKSRHSSFFKRNCLKKRQETKKMDYCSQSAFIGRKGHKFLVQPASLEINCSLTIRNKHYVALDYSFQPKQMRDRNSAKSLGLPSTGSKFGVWGRIEILIKSVQISLGCERKKNPLFLKR